MYTEREMLIARLGSESSFNFLYLIPLIIVGIFFIIFTERFVVYLIKEWLEDWHKKQH